MIWTKNQVVALILSMIPDNDPVIRAGDVCGQFEAIQTFDPLDYIKITHNN